MSCGASYAAAPRRVHNFDRSLMDQLPPGPTIELRLAAPFIDPSGCAVRQLLNRAAPQRLRIALQRNLSSFDGHALVAAAESVGDIEFRDVDAQRTLHGKLIEWTTPDGQTTAVVGSPNVTSAALLGTVATGHNCELAVSAPVTASLLLDAEPLAAAEVAAQVWNRPDISVGGPGLRLLGCRRSDDGLGVELVSRHAVDVTVETSVDGSPGSWGAKAVIPGGEIVTSGVTARVIDVPEVVGGAVRVVAVIGGRRVESAAVFVTDVRRCRPLTDVGDAPRLRQEYEIDQLIADEALAARFSFDLLRLLDHSARTRAATARPTGSVETEVHADVDRWQRFLDVVSYSLGTSLTELAFPGALPAPVTAQSTSWSVAEVADETELAEGETEDAIEEIDASTARPARRVPRDLRSRYRGWMRRWVSAVTRPPARHGEVQAVAPALPLRMTVGAIYLELLAAGVWGAEDGWRDELADLVTAIVADPAELGDTPQEGHGYLGSLVAVCLAILLHDASLHGGTPADIVARRAWEAGHEAAAGAEAAVVEALLLTSTQVDARLATPSQVAAVVDLACDALVDPNAEALAGFAAEGIDVERGEGAWVVHGGFRNPIRVAAHAVTELAVPEGIAVVASNGVRSTVMVRRGQVLAMADSTVRRWRIYQVRPPSTPASIFNGSEGVPPARQNAPLLPVPAEVLALGAHMGVDVGRLIGEFLPGPARNTYRGTTDGDW